MPRLDHWVQGRIVAAGRPQRTPQANPPVPEPSREVATTAADGPRTFYLFVDHTVGCETNTGVQRVVRGIGRALLERGERVRFIRWDPNSGGPVLIDHKERLHLARWNGPPLDLDAEGYPSPGMPQTLPIRHPRGSWLLVPEVMTISRHPVATELDLFAWARRSGLSIGAWFYDAIPLRRPEHVAMRPAHEAMMQQLLLVDVVWPISAWSGADLKAFWSTVLAADEGSMPRLSTRILPGDLQRARPSATPRADDAFILCVGTIEARKNQVMLLRAFRSWRAAHPGQACRLVLVGHIHPSVAKDVQAELEADPNVEHRGHVSDDELAALYATCQFTVFPSVEEGLGLPILESLGHGQPVVCADFGPMAEAAGPGCLMVDTRSEPALRDALERMLGREPGLLERLRQEASSRQMPGWDDYATAICEDLRPASWTGVRRVYLWLDATIRHPHNSGIQRVARQLARSLMGLGTEVVPLAWDDGMQGPRLASPDELAFLSRWNGPPANGWCLAADVLEARPQGDRGSWFLLPELPLERTPKERGAVLAWARQRGLGTAAVFFDAIPWTMRDVYPKAFAEAHGAYMAELADYDLILPISAHSADALLTFIGGALPRPSGIDAKVMAEALPGEFPERTRQPATAARAGPIRILCIGTVEPRKNHELLLRAFARSSKASKRRLELVVAGGEHSFDPALAIRVREAVNRTDGVRWAQGLDDTALQGELDRCDFTVYPSVEEGFGLPIVESMWAGRPTICASFGAMAEAARGGGALLVDVRDEVALSEAMVRLANDDALRARLAAEAASRPLRTWSDYAAAVLERMHKAIAVPSATAAETRRPSAPAPGLDLPPQPRLSVCISTYNRGPWLETSLRNWVRLQPVPVPGVEFLVVDNASTDDTPARIKPFLHRKDLRYIRNAVNVGMLGNLRVTANAARGRHVWILGDDDLLRPGALQAVLAAIDRDPGVALVYLNYAYTDIVEAERVGDLAVFLQTAKPIAPPTPDQTGPVRTLCAHNENFFTAIYTLVFRRDHAVRAYSQDTSGRPFSSMGTCIPTTKHVLERMMEAQAVWLGQPHLVVNLNVSWKKYASLWVLERLPEMYEQMEHKGVPASEIDRWRLHTLPGACHFFREILTDDPAGNAAYFDAARFVRRFRHLPRFAAEMPGLRDAYLAAQSAGHPAAKRPADAVFPNF